VWSQESLFSCPAIRTQFRMIATTFISFFQGQILLFKYKKVAREEEDEEMFVSIIYI
jgi:hypothetical protein